MKEGNYDYDFHIREPFLHEKGWDDMVKEEVAVHVHMDKQPAMIVLHLHIKGTLSVPCDRCLEPVQIPVDSEEMLYYKYKGTGAPEEEESFEDAEEIRYITPDTPEIDLTHFIYESIILQIPIKKVHKEITDCDPEVISILKNYQVN